MIQCQVSVWLNNTSIIAFILKNESNLIAFFQNIINFNEDEVVSVFTLSAVDCGFMYGLVKQKTMKFVCLTSPL